MGSVIDEFQKRIEEHPGKLLFAFLDIAGNIKESYTYESFDERTKVIASYIQKNFHLSAGDRVLLTYPAGLEMIASFFACVRLGLIPVPVYPPSGQALEASVRKMDFISDDCSAKAVLTDRSSYWSYKIHSARTNSSVSRLLWINTQEATEKAGIIKNKSVSEILFLQYTSGSTSEPKGVMVTHENVIKNCDAVVDHMPVGISWLPQYHDMGFIGYYLFFALKGGTTYGFSPADFIQRPALWFEAITKYRCTASSAPDFAFAYCLIPGKIPENMLKKIDLSSLRFLMTAAEPVNPVTVKKFYEKFRDHGLNEKSFFAAYGLAEFTLAVSNYGRRSLFLDSQELKLNKVKIISPTTDLSGAVSVMSCGNILQHTELTIVDVASLTPCKKGTVGEIWLQGPSKCLGYWRQEKLSQEIFEANLPDEKGTWLRTGDLGFVDHGELFVCGRTKDLIILRGLNLYPRDIELLVEEDEHVRKGCVVAFSNENKEELIVVAGVKNTSKLPDADKIRNRINQYAGVAVSELLFVPARSVSKTSSGKIMRFECKEKYLANQLPVISQPTQGPSEVPQTSGIQNTNGYAQSVTGYQLLFTRFKLTGSEMTPLGHSGLDSIKIAEFGHDLKLVLNEKGFEDLSAEVDLKLLQKIAVCELFSMLNALDTASTYARFKFRRAFQEIQNEYASSVLRLMKQDAMIVSLEIAKQPDADEHNQNGIFLTGGTGFFGPFLIKSLLEQKSDDIYVLVRADSREEGFSRLEKAFLKSGPSIAVYGLFKKRVKTVCGDLALPGLGLNKNDFDFISQTVHTVYHNGAYVNYLKDYEAMRDINVCGTREVIRLSMTGRKKVLNYISTTFIFGWSAKSTLFESDSNAGMEYLDFGYSQSKWVSDQVVLNAMSQGLTARIFRPALISPSIAGEGYNFDISIRLLAFMLKYGIGTTAQNQVSFTPADIAANNIVAISNIPSSAGHTFHVTRDEYSSMQQITELLGKLDGKSFRNFNLKAFVPEVVSLCTKNDLLFPLLNFLVRSVENITTMEFKRYDNSNYRKFRDQSPWGKKDPSLEQVVKGIYLFMINQQAIAKDLNISKKAHVKEEEIVFSNTKMPIKNTV